MNDFQSHVHSGNYLANSSACCNSSFSRNCALTGHVDFTLCMQRLVPLLLLLGLRTMFDLR